MLFKPNFSENEQTKISVELRSPYIGTLYFVIFLGESRGESVTFWVGTRKGVFTLARNTLEESDSVIQSNEE